MSDDNDLLPVYARPPGQNEIPRGVYVDTTGKMGKQIMKMAKVPKTPPIKSIPRRKIKRFF